MRQALHNEIFMDINFSFNFVDVRDVAAGMIAAEAKGRSGERYILGTRDAISTRRILELAQAFNPAVKIPFRPPKFVPMLGATLMELASKVTGKAPMLMRNQVSLYYGTEMTLNIDKAQAELGFNPRPPEQAIREAFAYLQGRNRDR